MSPPPDTPPSPSPSPQLSADATPQPHGPPPPATNTNTNTISGSSVLHGPSVQARDIHGGLHFHIRPEPPRADRPVPRQLPPVTALFLGRDADRRILDELCTRPPEHTSRIVVVTGLAGVGKTALVSHWLHEHADSYPDGQLYADLGGHTTEGESSPASPGTVLEALLVALGATSLPADTAQRSALWHSVTSELRIAVLLDNAFSAAQVRPLLLGTAAGLTVVTSRNSLTGLRVDGALVHRLDGLPAEAAVEFLAVGGGPRIEREPAAAREVVRLCGRLPLAVGLASAQLALRPHRSVSALAASLSHGQGHGAVDALRVDGEAVVRTALDLSYGLLPDTSAALYRLMGLLPTNRHDLAMVTAVLGGDESASDNAYRTELAVQALVEANLLQETSPDSYRLHDLVRPHARRLALEREAHEEPGERDRPLRRYVDWCLATTAAADAVLTPGHRLTAPGLSGETAARTPFDGPDEALAWLGSHRDTIMDAVRHCAQAGWYTSCWQLTDLAWALFLRLRPTEMWVEAHRLGLGAARRAGSRQAENRMLTSGAIGLRNAGRYTEAEDWYRQALERAVSDDDVRQQAQAVSGLGHLCLLTGRLDEAREHFAHALGLRESIGYRRGAALSRRRLGETALAAGDLLSAARCLRQAAAELHELDEMYEETRVLAVLGHVLDARGEHEEGLRRLREALNRFRAGDARSEHWEARCLEWLGLSAASRGDAAEATDCYEAARALFRRLDPSDAQRLDDRLRQL
ncbi:tetratricopeptide repeat protein [Streptomyces sp. NPDC047000]|uniref:tetratricopeptide repeat protein n=1 Tax=Streptomyces sp. NPDC047000 TaxID=3155474 RepID=UPI0033E32708